MESSSLDLKGSGRLLIVAAVPAEAIAVATAFAAAPPDRDWAHAALRPGVELVRTGVGKVNAAVAVARCYDPSRHGAVLNVGVAGALQLDGQVCRTPELGTVVIADESVYADEGIMTPAGWCDMSAAGFPLGGITGPAFKGPRIRGSERLIRAASAKFAKASERDITWMAGAVATVSTCSGTDALAREVASRTGAIAEAMEGAAIAHTLARLYGPSAEFLEIRVISNTTGDRQRQRWDLKGALGVLTWTLKTLIPA